MVELNHTLTEEIVCPVCGMRYPDSWELFDIMGCIGELKCDACGKLFTAQRITTIEYITRRVEA